MSRTRRLGLALGVVLVVWGVAVAFVPGLAGGFTASPTHLTAVGLVALLGGVAAIHARLTTDGTRVERPTPERRRSYPTPGDGFDRRLAALGPRGRLRGVGERRTVRDRLDELAVGVLVRNGDTEPVARDRLARGTWTDDPHAAAFFAEARATAVPLEDRLRAAFSTEPDSRRRARHAVDALARIADAEHER